MKWKSYSSGVLRPFRCLIVCFVLILLLFTFDSAHAQTIPLDPEIIQVSPYYSYFETTLPNGTPIIANIINGPSKPPLGNIPDSFPPVPENTPTGIIANFPSYSWVFGCSAVSGAMITAYYDRGAYTNMYTGPTGGGIYPLTDTGFGTWRDGTNELYPNNPLVASKQGVDGLGVRGSINDYWVSYGSPAADPYITGGWTEHTTRTSIGDWMGTSQSSKSNSDGSTAFYNYQTSSSPISCNDLAGLNPPDGNWGRREFYTSRGYTSTDCYNQNTDNNVAGGFSFANYKTEINAGHPVLIHLAGHSIVGYGYADPSTVYIRDTWSSNTAENRSMTWGGSYQDMLMQSVSILHLQSLTLLPPTNISLSSTSIAENKPINTTIGTFSSTDPNPGDTFTYTLVAGTGDTGNSFFNISGKNLRNSSVFNYEGQSTYSIRVRVTDQGGLTYDKVFTISVTNVNEAPTNIALSGSTIVENAAVDTTIGTFSTTDPDAGNTFSYSLVAGTGDTGNSFFNISGENLRNSSVFNYEGQSTYSIRVRVTDQGGLTFDKLFSITVTNVNEAPTNIALSGSTIAENAAADTTIGAFNANDPDTGDTFSYIMVAGEGDSSNSFFNISENSLRNSIEFDFETQSSYSIRVRVTDQGGLTYDKVFTITVTDVNEVPTDIALLGSTIAENAAVDTTIGAFNTTDPDAGNTFSYTLVAGTGDTGNSSFNILESSLRNKVVLDFETQSSYSIRVRVTDQGGLTYDKVFTITVTDVNEVPTDIALSGSTIAENAAVDTTIGSFSATDPDAGNTFTYSLISGDGDSGNSFFIISGSELKNSSVFDHETTDYYSIRVRAIDQGGLTFDKVFSITVTNVNEAPTNIALTGSTIAENAAVDTTIGTFNTADPDTGNTFTFTLVVGIGDEDNNFFDISGNALHNSVIFDYESDNSFSIRVRVTDQDGLFIEGIFVVDITDVAESPTEIALSASETPENFDVDTPIGEFSTIDPDGETNFTFTLVSGEGDSDNESFNISGNTLRNSVVFDFETQSSYSIRVRVTDQGGLNFEKAFEIIVTNVNETPYRLLLSNDTLPEGQPIGTEVGLLSSQDPDYGDEFEYTLVNGDFIEFNALFDISGNSLRTAVELDFPFHQVLAICVRSTDLGGLTYETVFTIYVEEVKNYLFLPLIIK